MPVALIENASTSKEKVFYTTIFQMPQVKNAESPLVIIIGEVVKLSSEYDK